MNPLCLEHCLTDTEKQQFEEDGFFAVENAIPQDMVARLLTAFDRVGAAHLGTDTLSADAQFNLLDFVGRDEAFIELLDWHTTFPKVWGILGWNIKLYHSHMILMPPLPPEARDTPKRLGWHQDSGRLNIELEGNPRPRHLAESRLFLDRYLRAGTRQLLRSTGQSEVELGRNAERKNGRPRGRDTCLREAGRCSLLRPAAVARRRTKHV